MIRNACTPQPTDPRDRQDQYHFQRISRNDVGSATILLEALG